MEGAHVGEVPSPSPNVLVPSFLFIEGLTLVKVDLAQGVIQTL
jgi:hypothetical protein